MIIKHTFSYFNKAVKLMAQYPSQVISKLKTFLKFKNKGML